MEKRNNKAPRVAAMLTVVLIFLVAWFISKYYFQFMLIQGESMEPSYHNLQLVVLQKNKKQFSAGDVIAFNCDGLSSVLVKRIVGVPGDYVEITDGTLYVNGEKNPYYEEKSFENAGIAESGIELQTDEYFVIGDNVPKSIDSRFEDVGPIKQSDIIGVIIKPAN